MIKQKIVVALKGIILHEGKILIVQRTNDDVGGGTWECVGGKMEFGEDLETALEREILEEVGLKVSIQKISYATTFNTHPTRQVVILSYLCNALTTDVILSDEHIAYQWATKDQLRALLPQEIIHDFKKNDIFSLEELS